MNTLHSISADVVALLQPLGLLGIFVISINIFLLIFARKILCKIYHKPQTDKEFSVRINTFRALNFFIILSFFYYQIYMPIEEKGFVLKFISILVVLYVSYLLLHIFNYIININYGRAREIDGVKHVIETYNSRLLSIFTAVFIFIIALISIIRILGFSSLLEAGGVIGFIGVFFALTQSAWAPDIFSGLIILNSGMAEVGDVVEFHEANNKERTIGSIYKTKVFHTEILNLVNNHRIMIKNSRLRDCAIHNLSKFASAKGLRERMRFYISYDVPEEAVRTLFEKAFAKAIENPDIFIDGQYPIEIGITDTANYAVEWSVYYYTKNVRNILWSRQLFRETILTTAKEENISLSTPTLYTNTCHDVLKKI